MDKEQNRQKELESHLSVIEKVFSGVRSIIEGQDTAMTRAVLAVITVGLLTPRPSENNGEDALTPSMHTLFEGTPGHAKTLLSNTLAYLFELSFDRIQGTPDIMPSNIIGSEYLIEGKPRFVKGPIFNNIVLVDEINRISPKSQAGFIQAMSDMEISEKLIQKYDIEYSSRGGLLLPAPFLVLATQNPREDTENVYNLNDSQLDRFGQMVRVRSNDIGELKEIDRRNDEFHKIKVAECCSKEELMEIRRFIHEEVTVSEEMRDYIARIVVANYHPRYVHRGFDKYSDGWRNDYVSLWDADYELREFRLREAVGDSEEKYRLTDFIDAETISPRAMICIKRLAKSLAFLRGRRNVLPRDIQKVAPDVLRHRVRVADAAFRYSRAIVVEEFLKKLLEKIHPWNYSGDGDRMGQFVEGSYDQDRWGRENE